MKKRIIPLLLALCLMTALCACAGPARMMPASEAAADAVPEPSAPAETPPEEEGAQTASLPDPEDGAEAQAEASDENIEPPAPLMTPCRTLLWIDGAQTETYTAAEGGIYIRPEDAADALGGTFAPEEKDALLNAAGTQLRLIGGSAFLLRDGEPMRMSAPALTDGDAWYAPAADLLPLLGLTALEDPELDQIYYTHIVKNDAVEEGYEIPVLMYHAVGDEIWGVPELFVSPSRLEAQLQALQEKGYTAITFEDLECIGEIEKPVMLTFDDGYDDNYTNLFPLLKKYNVKATIFVITDAVGYEHYLTREQIREMSDSGLVSIQSHTVTHGYLDGMDEEQLVREHYDSMIALARITGKQPFVLCYPSGRSSSASRQITAQYYEFALNMTGPRYETGDDPYRIWRSYISRDTDIYTFLSKIR